MLDYYYPIHFLDRTMSNITTVKMVRTTPRSANFTSTISNVQGTELPTENGKILFLFNLYVFGNIYAKRNYEIMHHQNFLT